VFPMLVAACLWYLALTSVLMVGQFYVERYFSKGFGTGPARAKAQAEAIGHGH
jgi:polar amino acid transport system permease protein